MPNSQHTQNTVEIILLLAYFVISFISYQFVCCHTFLSDVGYVAGPHWLTEKSVKSILLQAFPGGMPHFTAEQALQDSVSSRS